VAKLFKSLMRGSLGEQVTWAEEWKKASQAKAGLFKIIDAMPSVLDILRNLLGSELKRLGKTVDIDKSISIRILLFPPMKTGLQALFGTSQFIVWITTSAPLT